MFYIISCLVIGQAAYSSAYSSQNIQRKYSSKLHAEKDGNLLGEQIIELRDGLQSFQANAFESLYDRKISWDKNNTAASSSSGVKSTFFESLSTEELLEVIESDKYKDFQSVNVETVTGESPKVDESSGILSVSENPVDQDIIAEDNKIEVMKAQQSSIETFLSQQAKMTAVSPTVKKEIAVMKTELKENITENLEVEEDDEKSEPPSGGFFGFLNQDKSQVTTEKSTPPAPAVSPPPVVASVIEPSIPTEAKQKGFFDFLNKSPPVVTKAASIAPKEQPLPAVKASIPVPTVTKIIPTVESSTSKTQTTKEEKPAFFNFFNQGASKANSAAIPVATKSEDIVTTAIASKLKSKMDSKSDSAKMTSTIDPVPIVVKESVPVKTGTDGGFFGFFNDKIVEKIFPAGEPSVQKAVEPSVQKPASSIPKQSSSGGQKTPISSNKTPEGMNKMFQRSAQRLLKEDSGKIKSFQKSTDSFRSGVLPAEAFLKTIETLFGAENVESVIVPLIAELPERAAATELKAAYSKESAAKNKPSQPFKSPFSFSFGQPKKAAEIEAPAATAMIQAPLIKKAPVGARRPAASSKSAAAAVFRVPATVPIGKKVLIEKLMKAVIAGEIGEKAFFNEASTSLGKTKAIETMPSIIAVLPNDIGSKVMPYFKAYK